MSDHQAASTSRRINKARLPEFVGQLVRFLGRVESVQGDTLVLEAPDGKQKLNQRKGIEEMGQKRGGEVKCLLSGPDQQPNSLIVEVIGEVQKDLSLRQTSFLFNLGDELDLQAVNESINVTFHPQFVQFFEPSTHHNSTT
eukprot:GHVS01101451.1.p1 GENE.GHVS01101451.1~~GHVS01101451.1.p1  ORF type:complete len:141 (+),score=33.12 GHVS01101451.1:229-651(+)